MAKILITGGTGLVGGHLSKMLSQKQHEIVHLSRKPKGTNQYRTYEWNVQKRYLEPGALEGVEHIIHLAGAGVADQKWTAARKKVIIDSRIDSIRILRSEVDKYDLNLKSFISASAIGYYGMNTGSSSLTEASAVGKDFLAHVVKLWEAEADTFADLTTVAKVRIGVVLAKEAGVLKEIGRPVKLGLGAPLGTGKQFLSWIHIHDLCSMFTHIFENNLSGAYNATAPYPVTNKALTQSLAKALNKPLFWPNVPSFVLKIMLGEMAEMVLGGNYVMPDKIQSTGFKYRFEQLDAAIDDLCP